MMKKDREPPRVRGQCVCADCKDCLRKIERMPETTCIRLMEHGRKVLVAHLATFEEKLGEIEFREMWRDFWERLRGMQPGETTTVAFNDALSVAYDRLLGTGAPQPQPSMQKPDDALPAEEART